jgi:hypothetical protein
VSQRVDNKGFHPKDGDEMVNDEELLKEMKFEELCASGNCISMPAKQKMQIKVCSILKTIIYIRYSKIANLFYSFIMMTLSILTPVM